jgi:hypothetical protein
MPEQRRSGVGPAGLELRVEVQWCHECGADRTVQIIQLADDPYPVALCADCGAGIALWLAADAIELVDVPAGRQVARRGAA